MGTCIFTIVSVNYVAYAATLMQSVRRFHPEIARLIVLADEPRSLGKLDLAAEIISCDDMNIYLLENMKLWYSIVEFNTALKPYVFRHLFEKGFDFVFYLDPDILLYQPLSAAIRKIQDYSLILTPHIMRPLQEAVHPSDLSIIKTGVYNLGFAAISNDVDGRALVQWWCQRLFAHSRIDVAGNFFTDQRWMDLAPAFVEKSLILRDPGYNVAYWNLHERRIKLDPAGTWLSNDQPLVFFHFSGIDPEDPAIFSRHQDRFDVEALGEVAALCAAYRANVLANSWSAYRQAPYAYDSFGDGRPILDAMRRWIRNAIDEGLLPTDKPLRLGSTFFDAADTVKFADGGRLTRFAHQLWRDRPDLQSEFDLRAEGGFNRYVAWLTEGPAEREGIPDRLTEAALALRDGKPSQAPPLQLASPPWTRSSTH